MAKDNSMIGILAAIAIGYLLLRSKSADTPAHVPPLLHAPTGNTGNNQPASGTETDTPIYYPMDIPWSKADGVSMNVPTPPEVLGRPPQTATDAASMLPDAIHDGYGGWPYRVPPLFQ